MIVGALGRFRDIYRTTRQTRRLFVQRKDGQSESKREKRKRREKVMREASRTSAERGADEVVSFETGAVETAFGVGTVVLASSICCGTLINVCNEGRECSETRRRTL